MGGFVATRIADKIIAAIREPYILGEGHQAIQIGTRIGIAFYPEDAKDCKTLLALAIAAMYEAKIRGCNRYSLHAGLSATGNPGSSL
ncbi:MAG: diguanylate cyclase [Chromatiaceae bacterium]